MNIVAQVKDYGNGLLEAGYSVQGTGCQKAERGKSERRLENWRRSLSRAKANIRRRIISARLDYLLTLTYQTAPPDKATAYGHLKEFARLVRKAGVPFPYLAVHEYQKRGAIHFHLAVQGWQNVELLRSLWRKASGDARANVDVKAPQVGKRPRWGRLALAYYLAKYLGKDAADAVGLNGRRYSVTKGLPGPVVRRLYLPPHCSPLGYLKALLGRVEHQWESECGRWGFVQSWSVPSAPVPANG